MLKWMLFLSGFLAGFSTLSMSQASMPTPSPLTDDTALDQQVSEIQVKKELSIDFDSSLKELHSHESKRQYREKPPTLSNSPRLKGPIERVSRQRYRQ